MELFVQLLKHWKYSYMNQETKGFSLIWNHH